MDKTLKFLRSVIQAITKTFIHAFNFTPLHLFALSPVVLHGVVRPENAIYRAILFFSLVLQPLALVPAFAAVPQSVVYQGKLSDASGNVKNGSFDFRLKLYDASTSGTLLLTDEQAAVSVTNGVYTLSLGQGTLTPGSASTLSGALSGSSVYLEIEVKASGDPSYETLSPRIRLESSPYALRAEKAEQVSLESGDFTLTIAGTELLRVTSSSTIVKNVLDLQNNRLINLASPSLSGDAATKGYVDSTTGGLGAALLISTQTFSGGNVFSSWSVFSGSITALNALNRLAGDGSAITGLDAGNIAAGQLSASLLDSSSVTLQGNSFNQAGRLLLLDGSGLVSLAQIPSLPAGQITSGTFGDSFVAISTAAVTSGKFADDKVAISPSAVSGLASELSRFDQVATDTTTIQGSLSGEIAARAALATAVASDTTTLKTDITNEAAARSSLVSAVASDTTTLKTELTAETSARLALGASVASDTTTLKTGVDANAVQLAQVASDTTTLKTSVDSNVAQASANAARLTQVAADTTTLKTELTAESTTRSALASAVAVDTTSLRTSLTAEETARAALATAVASDTATLKTELTAESTARSTLASAVATDTTTLKTELTAESTARSTLASAVASDTTTLKTSLDAETSARGTLAAAVAIDTTSLRTSLDAETAARSSLAIAVASDTTTLKTSVDANAAQAGANANRLIQVATDTTTIQGSLSGEIASRQALAAAVASDTTTLKTELTAESTARSALASSVASDTTTLKTSLDAETSARGALATAVASDTTTLKTSLDAESSARGALATAVAADTTTLRADLDASGIQATQVAADTTTLRNDLSSGFSSVAVDTMSLRTSLNAETAARGSLAAAVAIDTTSLRTSLDAETSARSALATAVASDTTTLKTEVDSKVSRSGDSMSGQLTVGSTLTVSGNAFSVGGSTLVVLGGNLGIGTGSPEAKLDVNGAALLRNGLVVAGTATIQGADFGVGGRWAVNVAGNTTRLNMPSGDAYLWSNGGTDVFGMNGTAAVLKRVLTVEGPNGQVWLNNSGNTKRFELRTDLGEYFAVRDHDGNLPLVIGQQNGLVGIGTTAMTHKLHVNGGILAASSVTASSFHGNGSALTSVQASALADTIAASTLTAKANLSGITVSTGLFVTGGNVGIGTTFASEVLDVAGNMNASGNVVAGGQVLASASANPGFGFSGDSGTGIRRDASQSMLFLAGNSAGLKITSSLTSIPSDRPFQTQFDGSAGTAAIGWTTDTNSGLRRLGSDNIALQAGGVTTFQINPSSAVVTGGLTATGDVGIGTASPETRLSVVGGDLTVRSGANVSTVSATGFSGDGSGLSNVTASFLADTMAAATLTSKANLSGITVSTGLFVTGGNVDVTGNIHLSGKLTTGGATDAQLGQLVVSDGGQTYRLGLGRTSDFFNISGMTVGPAIVSSAGVEPLFFFASNGMFGMKFDRTADNSAELVQFFNPNNGANGVRFGFSNTQNDTENTVLTLTTNKVGIGTTGPSSLLDVNNGSITVRGTNAGISVAGSPVLTAAIGASLSSTQTFTGQNAFTAQMTVSSHLFVTGGNVGIGTTGPAEKLHVEGNAQLGNSGALKAKTSGGTVRTLIEMSNASGADRVTIGTAGGNGAVIGTINDFFLSDGSSFLGLGDTQIGPRLAVKAANDTQAVLRLRPNGSSYTGNFLQIQNSGGASQIVVTSDFKLGLGTGPSNRLTVSGNADVTGNVGISSAAPTEKLVVGGNVAPAADGSFDLGSSVGPKYWRNLYLNGDVDIGAGTFSVFNGSNQNLLEITNGGNVGIATATPQGLLHVGSGSSPILLVTSGGNIGIGQTQAGTVPGKKLDVVGTVRMTAPGGSGSGVTDALILRKLPTTNGDGSQIRWERDTVFEASPETVASIGAFSSGGTGQASGVLTFGTPNVGSFAERMRISSDGNLGIGTTSPAAKLDVAGDARFGTGVNISTFSSGNLNIPGTLTAATLAGSASGLTNVTASVLDDSVTASTLTAKAGLSGIRVSTGLFVTGGNVGIGLSNSLSKLDVGGGAAFGSYAGVNAAPSNGLIVSGNVGIGTTNPTAAKLHVDGAGFDNIDIGTRGTIRSGTNSCSQVDLSGHNGFIQINRSGCGGGDTRLILISGTQTDQIFTNSSNAALDLRGHQHIRIQSGQSVSGDISLQTGSSTRMTVKGSDGNVGVGASAPAARLDVAGDAQFGSGAAKSTFTSSGNLQMPSGASITIGSDGVLTTASGAAIKTATQTFSGQNTFAAQVTVSSNLFVSGGNVGIGTTIASNLLSVQGTANFTTAVQSPLLQPLSGSGNGVSITANGGSPGGAVSVTGGTAGSASVGGAVTLTAGSSASGGIGGSSLRLGAGGEVDTDFSGAVLLKGGSGGDGQGHVVVQGGDNSSAGAGNVTVRGGDGTSTGTGGGAAFRGGSGGSSGGSGGDVSLTGGASPTAAAGKVSISGGSGASGAASVLLQSSGGNVGIATAAPQGLFVVGNGTMVVTSAGNVGLGTSSPSARLDVSGGINASGVMKLSDGSASAPAYSFLNSSNTGIFRSGANKLDLSINGSNSVSFGNASASNLLQLTGNVTQLSLTNNGSSGRTWAVVSTADNWPSFGGGKFAVYDTNNGIPRLIIEPNAGNVGIGATNPATRLAVEGGDLTVRSGANVSTVSATGFAGDGSNLTNVRASTLADSIAADTLTAKANLTGITVSTGLFVTAGNVGIGTTAPAKDLEIRRNATSAIRLAHVGSRNWDIRTETIVGNSDRLILDSNDNVNTLVLTQAGNVGIGTASPGGRLELGSGQILAPSGTSGSPAYSFTGDSNLGIFRESADNLALSAMDRVKIFVPGGANPYLHFSENLGSFSGGVILFGSSSAGDAPSIGRLGADTLGIVTNSLERVRIDSAGNVGISSSAPQGLFVVGSGTMVVTSAGNVGIGTSGPIHRLHVFNSLNGDYAVLVHNSGGDAQGLLIRGSDGSGTNPLLRVEDNNSNARLVVQEDGDMAVGTGSVGSNNSAVRLRVAGGDIVLDASRGLGVDTADGSDSGSLNLSGAGGNSSGGQARGAFARLYGNEAPGEGGNLYVAAGNSGSGSIFLQTGSEATRLAIDSSGNIRMGSGATVSTFTSTGDLQVRSGGNITIGSDNVLTSASGASLASTQTFSGQNTFTAQMSVGSHVFVTAGNVGIGTTNPAAKLQVNKDHNNAVDGWDNAAHVNAAGAADPNKRLQLGFDTTGNFGWIRSVQAGTGYRPIVLAPDGGSNVGVGTTTPVSKLHIDAGTAGGITIDESPVNGPASINIRSNKGSISTPGDIIGGIYWRGARSATNIGEAGAAVRAEIGSTPIDASNAMPMHLTFFTNAPDTGTGLLERMRIDQSGNVGVGTTTPAGLLEANGTSGIQMLVTNTATANGANYWLRNTADNASAVVGLANEGSLNKALGFFTGGNAAPSAGTERMRISSAGNVGIATAAPQGLFVVGSGTMVVTSAGNVGIGTAAPGNRLHVLASNNTPALFETTTADARVSIKAGGADTAMVQFVNSAGTTMGHVGHDLVANVTRLGSLNGNVALRAGGSSDHLSVAPSGNVGIGTTAPGALLHVVDGDIRLSTTTPSTRGIFFADGSFMSSAGVGSASSIANATDAIVTGDSDANSTGSVILRTGAADRLTVANSGNVGIGNTSPAEFLSVGNGAAQVSPRVGIRGSDSAGVDMYVGSTFTGQIKAVSTSDVFITNVVDDDAADILFLTKDTSERMRIKGSGNVGIASTTPQGLFVVGNGTMVVTSDGRVGIGTASPNSGSSERLDVAGYARSFAWRSSRSDGDIYLQAQTAADDVFIGTESEAKMTIRGGGNVGIGTEAPTAKLHVVDGDIRLSTTTPSTRGIFFADGSFMSSAGVGSASSIANATDAIVTGDSDANSTGSVILRTGAADRLTVANSGNVGIGTTNPGSILEVSASGGVRPRVLSTSALGSADSVWEFWTDGGIRRGWVGMKSLETYPVGLHLWNTDNTPIVFGTSNAEQMRITSSGNVGIASTTPQGLFVVGNGTMMVTSAGNVGIGTTNPQVGLMVEKDNGSGWAAWFRKSGSAGGVVLGAVNLGSNVNGSIQGVTSGGSASDLLLNPVGGKVGIGTTAPGALLHVVDGDIRLSTTTPSTRGIFFADGSFMSSAGVGSASSIANATDAIVTGDSDANSTGSVILRTGAADRLTVANSGNVGIGTTAPIAKLHVIGGASNGIIIDNNSDTNFLAFRTGGAQKWTQYVIGNDFRFADTVADRVTLQSGGNVGISTTNPQGLFVVGNGTMVVTSGGNVGIGTGNPTAMLQVRLGLDKNLRVALSAGESRISSSNDAETTDAPLDFNASRYGFLTGNVGIGTTNPNKSLHLSGNSIDYGIRITQTASGSGQAALVFTDNPTRSWGFGTLSTAENGNFVIRDFTALAHRLVIDTSGNVGIGTTNPTAKLHVGGTSGTDGIRFPDGTLQTTASPWVVSGSSIYFANSGSVGIGTTAPTHKIHIKESANTGIRIEDMGVNSFHLESGAGGGYIGVEPGDIVFKTGITIGGSAVTTGTEVMRIKGSNVGIASSTPQGLFVVGNGTMAVTSAGNVGIGTVAPATKLEIVGGNEVLANFKGSGSARISVQDTGGHAMVLGSGSNFAFFGISGQAIGSGLNIKVTNVGIGTTTPGAKLHVEGSVKIVDGTQQAGRVLTSDANGLASWSAAGSGDAVLSATQTFSGANTFASSFTIRSGGRDILFSTSSTAGISSLFVQGTSGNVGIGTTAPGALLLVSKAQDSVSAMQITNASGGTSAQAQIRAENDSGNQAVFGIGSSAHSTASLQNRPFLYASASSLGHSIIADGAGDIRLYTAGLASANERMRIDNSGNVGIGTTSPGSAKLQLVDATANDTGYSNMLIRNSFAASSAALDLESTDTGGRRWRVQSLGNIAGRAGNFDISDITAVAVRLSITPAGNVGIASTTPQGLFVVGNGTMVVTSAGNVGIGTTNPQFALDVTVAGGPALRGIRSAGGLTGSTRTAAALLLATGGTMADGFGPTLEFQVRDVAGTDYPIAHIGAVRSALANDGTTPRGSLAFILTNLDGVSTERVRIRHNGDVGIGTTAPQGRLDVRPLSSTAFTLFISSQNGAGTMVVTASGNVGIGTTAPANKLDVAGAIQATGPGLSSGANRTTIDQATAGHSRFLATGANTSTRGKITLSQNTSDGSLYQDAATIDASGNVGIGTAAPGAKLHVEGSVKIVDGTQVAGRVLTSDANGLASWSAAGTGDAVLSATQTFSGQNTFTAQMSVSSHLFVTAGNVGIGTTVPPAPLSVIDTANNNGFIHWGGSVVRGEASYSSSGGFVQMGSGSNHPLRLSVAALERLTIDTAGNVGIGTTGPSTLLHVRGADATGLLVERTNGTVTPVLRSSAGKATVKYESGDQDDWEVGVDNIGDFMVFNVTDNVIPLRIKGTNGNVRIGDTFTTPQATLHVSSAGASASANVLLISSGASSGQELMAVTGNGNVGIGTTGPATLLHVDKNQDGPISSMLSNANAGTAAEADLVISNTGTTGGMLGLSVSGTGATTTGGFVQDGATLSAGTLLSGGLSIMTRASAPLRFYTNGHTNERMRIDETGNVGIGTTAPTGSASTILHVNGTTSQLRLTNTTSGTTATDGTMISHWSDNNLWINNRENAAMFFLTNDTHRMAIDSAGNVGIGTSSPAAKLHVLDGDIKISTTSGSKGIVFQDGTTQTTAGKIVQIIHRQDYPVVSGTTAIPFDTSIPQQTEGFEVMTASITPKSASSMLMVEAGVQTWDGATTEQVEACLFRDLTADALTVAGSAQVTANGGNFMTIRYQVPASATSLTTFKIRVGGNGSTIYFNDRGGAGIFGGRLASYMTVTEISQ